LKLYFNHRKKIISSFFCDDFTYV
ncbi:hypothetical protein A5853_002530, partial [Enterococcus faecium]